MAEYTGRVAYVVDPDTNKGKYVAMPDTDWVDTGDPGKNEQHPDSQLTVEEMLGFDEVVWVDTPETLETVELEAQTVPLKDYAAGTPGGRISITHTTPPDVEGFTDLGDGEFAYTFGARQTQKGGGHFELASAVDE